MQFPAQFFIRFFYNHGMVSVNERPQWYVIKGGSREYVKKLVAGFADRIQHNTAVKKVLRSKDKVTLTLNDGAEHTFDQVFIASHSDQALAMLADPSERERQVLEAIPYQENEAILHTDDHVLPKRRLAWAAWNYHILPKDQDRVALTYNMNILQGLNSPTPFCVTLNNSTAIDPRKIVKRLTYHHPIYTPEGIQAQQCQAEINGVNRTYFCGAYWRFGFHEDGVVSALDALQHFEEKNNAQLFLRRAS